jgi:hypothetical protein
MCELGGPSHATKTALRAHSTDHLLNVQPYVLEDTIITVLPDLPSYHDYQSVQELTIIYMTITLIMEK